MKKILMTLALVGALLGTSRNVQAEGAVGLDNYASDVAVYLFNTSTLAPDFSVQVMYSVDGGSTWLAVTASPSGDTIFPESEPGYFDGGLGLLSAAANNQANVQFQVFAWTGASSYAEATIKGTSAIWTQSVGANVGGTTPPAPVDLLIPGSAIVMMVPEPTTIVLGALGGLALLVRRRKE